MTKRYWHVLNKKTNPLGFGCWQIAGSHFIDGKPNGWGQIDEREAVNLLIAAINSGIDFFDTAQGYNNGKSEELLGKALVQTNTGVVVCTKISLTPDEIIKCEIKDDFEQRVNASLKRLNSERIDILLIHNPPDDLDWYKFDYNVLNNLRSQGKIGTFGVSSRGIAGAKKVLEARFGTVLEWVFNIFERRPVHDLFPLVGQNEFNFIARSPLSRGFINPNYLNVFPAFEKDDFRSTLPKEWLEWTIDSLKRFHKNGVRQDEIVRASILYTLQFQAVTSSIIGVRTAKQLEHLLEMSASIKDGMFLNEDFLVGIPECFPKWA